VATRGERQRATRSQEHGWEAAHGSITGMGGMSREQGGGGGACTRSTWLGQLVGPVSLGDE
jgi:hypothetical protein